MNLTEFEIDGGVYNFGDTDALRFPGNVLTLPPKVYLGRAATDTTLGSTMRIEAHATSEDCRFQWYLSKNGGGSWVSLGNGYRAKSITFELTDARNGYMYRCKVTDQQNGWSYYTDTATVMADSAVPLQNLEAEA